MSKSKKEDLVQGNVCTVEHNYVPVVKKIKIIDLIETSIYIFDMSDGFHYKDSITNFLYEWKITKILDEPDTSTHKQLALEFNKWMKENDTKENAEKWFHYSDSEMYDEWLIIYLSGKEKVHENNR